MDHEPIGRATRLRERLNDLERKMRHLHKLDKRVLVVQKYIYFLNGVVHKPICSVEPVYQILEKILLRVSGWNDLRDELDKIEDEIRRIEDDIRSARCPGRH